MGTRNLVCVVVDGQMKVAQYGQWDGYLEGQGKNVLDFLAKANIKKFTEAVRACRFITDAEVDALDSKNWQETHPQLSRDRGAEILSMILNGKYSVHGDSANGYKRVGKKVAPVRELVDSSSFAGDGLFCEYAYVLDLDRKMLECYRGFNKDKSKLAGRFKDAKVDPRNAQYTPVTLFAEMAFSEAKNGMALAALQGMEEKMFPKDKD